MNSLRLAAVSLALSACGGFPLPDVSLEQSPPDRTSPVPQPDETSLDEPVAAPAPVILDLRRDGVFAVQTERGVEVRRVEGGVERLLATAAGRDGLGARLVSRADDSLALATWDALHTFDGATLRDQTPRLLAALLAVHPTDLVQILGLDLATDGTLTVAIAVGGQGGDAPYNQLCTLGVSGRDRCEDADALVRSDAVVVEGSRTYVLANEQLYVREAGGAWTSVTTDRVVDLRSVEGGRVAYVQDLGFGSALHVLGPTGLEERQVAGVWGPAGHSGRGLWEVSVASQGDGSCRGSWGTCHEALLWAQLVVTHVGEERVEVAHLDSRPGDELYQHREVPLSDGGLRLTVAGRVYLFPVP